MYGKYDLLATIIKYIIKTGLNAVLLNESNIHDKIP